MNAKRSIKKRGTDTVKTKLKLLPIHQATYRVGDRFHPKYTICDARQTHGSQ